MIVTQSIQLCINDVVVAGGMESMSNVPKYVSEARPVISISGYGSFTHSITRDDQDNYAVQSFERGISAQDSGAFSWEIVPVEVSGGRGKPSTTVDKDEFDAAKLRNLRPSFKETGGTVTAGNASSISDGAAALVLVSGKMALELGLPPSHHR
ncbi:hypothetical protein MLD38_028186 [Melastoma candidum]|uniref:Uncharacterized protein n=1 Tax=Melastoma candidum TaxID=119954 RepID=A0ACB9N1U3_9MYRT|nr:hypothetical protein MLD38_028186 [Melastoma candidum]